MSATDSEKPARIYTVGIIGDADLADGDPKYELARAVGRGLVDAGYRILTGGGTGIMEAASRGARESGAWSPGTVIAILPGNDPDLANPYAEIVIPTGLGHTRNTMTAQADALIAIGGRAGTLSEIAMGWIHHRLIIGMQCEGWSGKLAGTVIDDRQRFSTIPEDRVHPAEDAATAVALVQKWLDKYALARRAGG